VVAGWQPGETHPLKLFVSEQPAGKTLVVPSKSDN